MDFTRSSLHTPARASLAASASPAMPTSVSLKSKCETRTPTAIHPLPPLKNPHPSQMTKRPSKSSPLTPPSSIRRRSVAFSEFGEQSMDMDEDETAPYPHDFLNHRNEYDQDRSALDDDEFSDADGDDDDDMEITEAIPLNIARKRSLSLGAPRRSSIAPTTSSQGHSENQLPPQDDSYADASMSSAHSQSFTSDASGGEDTQPMEFTVPIARSLRPPEPPSELWQQLRAMTHAGAEPYEPPAPESDDEDALLVRGADDDGHNMDLTDAVVRLQRARDSLGLPHFRGEDSEEGDASVQEDSFTNTEDSFADDMQSGDRTVNVTSLMRMSIGGMESSMDVTSVYNAREDDTVVRGLPSAARSRPAPSSVSPPSASVPSASSSAPSTSTPPTAPEPAATPRPSVFSLPWLTSAAPKSPAAAVPSPAKPAPATIPKPFAFSLPRLASPAVRAPAPSIESPTPSRLPQPSRGTAAFAPPSARKSPLKRPAPPEAEAEHQPSPAKRPAVGKLAPAKKAMFEQSPAPAPPRTNTVRRPSGYFAQRKSLGAGVLPVAPAPAQTGPKKAPTGLGRGRASMGAAPSGAGLGLPSKQGTPGEAAAPLYPDVAQIVREDPPTPTRVASPVPRGASCEREALRQAVAAPGPTRGSPAPSPRPSSPAPAMALRPPPVSPPRVASPAAVPAPGPLQTNIPRSVAQTTPPAQDVEMKEPERPTVPTVTQEWREGVQDEDAVDEDEEPPISIEQFFAMTGIRFMDELTMPKPRPSIVPPMQLRSRGRRRSSTSSDADPDADEEPVALAEFSIAMAVEVPALELYTAVSNDLSAWIEESKKICLQAEHETEKVTPELFREFASADESEQAILLHQLKLIKSNNYGMAKSQWYDWRMDWVHQLYGRAEQEFANLESDAQVLAKVIKQSQELLPELREEYSRVIAELKQEEADIAEIENADQDYLHELKSTIAEQTIELDTFRTDVSEARAKLDRLEEKLADIDSEKRETSSAISHAQHIIHIQKESTSAEVFRLKDELEALQDLHLWRATKVTAELIEFVYASRYQVSMPCIKHKPILAKVNVGRAPDARTKERDAFPRFTDTILQTARQLVAGMSESNVRKIIEHLGDFWSSCAQLRSQLTFLAIKYPLAVEAVQNLETNTINLRAKATVLFPSAKGKAYISFILDSQTYSRWPTSIGSLKWDVEVAYGHLQRDRILSAVSGRISQATAADSHGCLLDACIEATEQY
ncbi:Spc7 kinetochore protein-domain-containing protein [Amylocystis lapponica]|nr:Spc7 kinetochore protein-domain-containing protein [Amylocystis lapponica]